jgi:hypothetical protein
MEMDELKSAVQEIVTRNMPSMKIVRINSEDGFDSDGDESLFIRVVMRSRPSREASRYPEVVDQLRTWLATKDDRRFPYMDFVTEEDERELQQTEA